MHKTLTLAVVILYKKISCLNPENIENAFCNEVSHLIDINISPVKQSKIKTRIHFDEKKNKMYLVNEKNSSMFSPFIKLA